MKHSGFTLAELLIALAILVVIATFTIPKVLTSQADTKSKAIAKEAASMVSGAYVAYKQNNSATANTLFSDLTPYMNYVSINTTATLDAYPAWVDQDCSDPIQTCLVLHNGATMMYRKASGDGGAFGGTGNLNAIYFYVDTDGPTVSGQKKSVLFFIYYSGRITSAANVTANTTASDGSTYTPGAANDPTWFNWN